MMTTLTRIKYLTSISIWNKQLWLTFRNYLRMFGMIEEIQKQLLRKIKPNTKIKWKKLERRNSNAKTILDSRFLILLICSSKSALIICSTLNGNFDIFQLLYWRNYYFSPTFYAFQPLSIWMRKKCQQVKGLILFNCKQKKILCIIWKISKIKILFIKKLLSLTLRFYA